MRAAAAQAANQDLAEGAVPLSNGELMFHLANRFGFGISPVDPGLLPDRVTAVHIPNVFRQVSLHAQSAVENPLTAELIRAAHRGVWNFRIEKVRNHDSIDPVYAGFNFRPSVRRAFTRGTGDLNNIDLTGFDLPGMVQVRAEISNDQRTNPDEGQRKLALAEIVATRGLVRDALKIETLIHQTLGSVRMQNGVLRDLQINLTRVLSEFWFNHFNIDTDKSTDFASGPLDYENLILSHQYGTVYHMLGAVIRSPAMLAYLDNSTNKWEGTHASNQNLGRELLELHTFGSGPRGAASDTSSPYNQTDVEVAAAVLTGHNALRSATTYGYVFFAERHFNGSFNQHFWLNRAAAGQNPRPLFFDQARLQQLDGTGGAARLNLVLYWLAGNAFTKRNLCRKLSQRFMVGGEAGQAVIASCVAAYGDAGNLKAMYRAIMTSPEIYRRNNFRRKIMNPHELVIAKFRSLGVSPQSFMSAAGVLQPERIVQAYEEIDRQIRALGIDYRSFADPTGYEMQGYLWLNSGFVIGYTRLGFSFAHLDRQYDLNLAIRDHTVTPASVAALLSIGQLPDLELAANVSAILYGGVAGTGVVNRLTTAQAHDIRDLVLNYATRADQIPNSAGVFERSIPDSLLAISFHSKYTLFK